MSDIFIEQIVKKQKNNNDTIKTVGAYILAVLVSGVSMAVIPQIFIFILIGSLFGAYYFTSKLNIEYEYSFTNTDLDIDCIYNKQKRKRIQSLDLKESIAIYKSDNPNRSNQYRELKTLDYSSGNNSDNTYTIIHSVKDNQVKIIIEPNESLLNGISTKISSRIYSKN